ncbi:hypothetical protein Tco_1393116 [Tanacetum coccineum]
MIGICCPTNSLDEYFNPPPRVCFSGSYSCCSTDMQSDQVYLRQLLLLKLAPSASTSSIIQETLSSVISKGVEEQSQPAHFVDDPFLDILTSEPSFQKS